MASEEKGKLSVLEEEYNVLRKKYKLAPSFADLDREFELGILEVEDSRILLKRILENIAGIMNRFINLIEPIVNPSPDSLHSLIESKMFDNVEISKLFVFYKKLWFLIHEQILASLEDEQAQAEYINKVWKQWPEIKKETKRITIKICKGWGESEQIETHRENYVG